MSYLAIFCMDGFSSEIIFETIDTPGSSLCVAQHITEEMQTSPPVVPHVAFGLIPRKFASKDNNEIISCRYYFLTFLYNFEFVLGFLYLTGKVFDIMHENLSYGNYSLPSRKLLSLTLTVQFF